ncbi:flagellar FlbD family protein [Anaerocolumna sp. AGMB13020]|uniref:flagellar FlbD family protein n=1 Tax=Anaerocolumna sp. AGMB13020 TaxID=3081750 RepID=UPI00295406B5|nr:flagellar FlbD family protein [Anaerocolumna sp. AGMB13020]WOO36536.1 flagellar FlbD family protein [Anaerocolumna sp. AGMB13020]
MINVTKLSGVEITLNCDLIETIEEVPETVITLNNGKKILVKESRQDVTNLIKYYKKELFSQYISLDEAKKD